MADTVVVASGTISTTPAATPAVTPGWKTSEYWLSLLAIVLGALTTSGLIADGSTTMRVAGMIMAVLATLGYTAARASVKKAAS